MHIGFFIVNDEDEDNVRYEPITSGSEMYLETDGPESSRVPLPFVSCQGFFSDLHDAEDEFDQETIDTASCIDSETAFVQGNAVYNDN